MRDLTFEDRVARLEEHVVSKRLTADELLAQAEKSVAEGGPWAAFDLNLAKLAKKIETLEDALEEDEEATPTA